MVFGVFLSHVNPRIFEWWFVRDNSLINWLSVFALAACAFICFYRVYLLYPFRSRIFIFCLSVMGGLFLFLIGKEINWGRELMQMSSLSTNMYIAAHLSDLYIIDILIIILMVLYLLFLPWIYNRFESVSDLMNAKAIPVPRGFHIFSGWLLFIVIQLAASERKGELVEFSNYWILFIILLRPYNRSMFSRKIFRH
ncbi:MAG: hypothetical protein OXB84_09200 [Halobacteriovoraceae bacterium]|nr:hypothetical protein [Halobacteriovoraceae bacterium]